MVVDEEVVTNREDAEAPEIEEVIIMEIVVIVVAVEETLEEVHFMEDIMDHPKDLMVGSLYCG